MENKFVVTPKDTTKKEEKSIVMTLRLNRNLQEEFDKLSKRSGRTRNELMCMALQYALDNLEFTPEIKNEKEPN
ncbi:MAG: CopG family transcriptional regulator [Clostridiales bacterium]|jgi:metal-responsive CopG/Arc/MetJ family transcriptional regulator|nr:CopG family transcriptional regulator [Clostridiales bacterium]